MHMHAARRPDRMGCVCRGAELTCALHAVRCDPRLRPQVVDEGHVVEDAGREVGHERYGHDERKHLCSSTAQRTCTQ